MTRRTLTLAFCLTALAAWLVLLRPTALGGPASYVFVSGTSMQPTLETGDLVLLQRADAYQPGDIVAFRTPEDQPGSGALVIHRIIGGDPGAGFVMRGDNKPVPDEWRPTADDVAGKLWIRLPGMGSVVGWLKQPSVFASLVAGAVVLFIMLGGGTGRRRHPATAGSVDA
jgi:signal peptidase